MDQEKKWQWPARICPWSGIKFIPKRKNQIYFSREYQILAANDRRNRNSAGVKQHERQLLHNFKILQKISGKLEDGECFHISLLKYEDFYFGIEMSRTLNERTGNLILWTYQYGLEMVDPEKELFVVNVNNQ